MLILAIAVVSIAVLPGVALAAAPATPSWATDPVVSGDGTMTLDWKSATGATGYQYRYTNSVVGFFECTVTCVRSDWAATDGGLDHVISKGTLTVGTTYWFQVRAVNTNDDPETYSDPSETRSARQRATPPAVKNLSATAGDAQVTLTWTDLAAYDIVNYQYIQSSDDGSSWTDWEVLTHSVNGATATGTVLGLSNGTTYSFQVRGTNHVAGSTREGPGSETVSATPSGPPAAPADLRATAQNGSVRLRWNEPNDDDIDKYQIRQKEKPVGAEYGDFSNWADIPSSDADTTDHTVSSLTNGTEYTFEVRAVDSDRAGPASSAIAMPTGAARAPSQMSNVRYTVTGVTDGSGGTVTFIWDDPGEGFANRYEYRHKCQNPQVSCDNTFTTESWINAADRSSSVVADDSFSMTIPGNNSVVYFQLRAVNATPNPDLPGPVTAVTVSRSNTPGTSTPPPDAPTGFSAAAEWDDTNTQWDIVLSWTDPSDTDIDKYQYRQSTDGGGNWNPDWTDIDPSDASTVRHRINGVTASTTYTFQIRAVDTDLGDRGAGALSRSEATTPGAPNAPTLDSATATDDTTTVDVNEAETEIVLSWTAGAGITGVVVDDYEYRQFVSGDASWSAWNSISGDGSETTYTVTKLVASTTYDFQLRAKAGSLASDPSETVSAKTAVPAEGVPQPEPPTGLRATAGNEQVTLDWGHPNPGEVKWYRYRFAEGNDASSGEWQQIPGTGATMTYTVTGLENGTTYNFQVQAAGGGDDNVSAASETATATATPRRPRGGGSLPQPPSAPAGLTVTPGNGQATLAWNDPQDPSITGYVYTQTPGDPSGHRIAVPAVVDGRMTHTVTGLTNGVEYAFQLRAETAAGLGAALASVAVMPMAPLTVNFAQTEYTVGEGDETSVEVRISPAADRRVVVPLTVTHQGGATSRDYDEIPASIVFEVGATAAAVAVAALADQADDPDESIVIGFGSLPGVVSAGEPSTTTVRFLNRRRTAQFEDSLEVILEAMARSRAASAQTAVESRFERYRQLGRLRSFAATASGDGPFSGEAEAHALARADATAAPDRAWSESPLAKGLDLPGLSQVSFELLGNHGEQGQGGKSWMPTVWGQGDLQHFSDTVTAKGLDYQGRLSAAHMGLDLYTGEHVLLGVSYMHSWGDVDYTADGTDGVLEDSLDTIHPYLYWQPSERFSVWGMGGWGSGQVEVTESQGTYDFDADFRMLSGGLRSVLIKGSRTQLGLRADAFTASLETQAAQGIRRVTGTANRGRLMLELVHDRPLAAGRSLSLKVEAGGRFDRGEADEGAGAETGLRLAFLDAVSGLDLALHGRVLLVHEWQDYRDWGWGVQVSWDPGRKHRGLHLSMMSSQGHHVGGKTTLWDNSAAITRSLDTNYLAAASQTLMDGEVAYGFDTRGGGLLTPYSRMRWAGQSRELRLGTRYSLPSRSILGRSLALGLEGMRRENLTDLDNPEFALQLYLSL